MKRAARWLRSLADRIDYEGAPKAIHWSFTFEDRRGIMFREDGRGCPLWYYGDADYERAHAEAGTGGMCASTGRHWTSRGARLAAGSHLGERQGMG